LTARHLSLGCLGLKPQESWLYPREWSSSCRTASGKSVSQDATYQSALSKLLGWMVAPCANKHEQLLQASHASRGVCTARRTAWL
jgi:hypothetical protein